MNITYERINELCKDRGTTYNAVCKAVGVRPSVIGNLKSREKSVLKADTATKLANYFGVTVDFLLGEEKIPSPKGDGYDEKRKIVNELFDRCSPEDQSLAIDFLKRLSQHQ